MKIFAMDTSSLTATVAVLDEDKVMGEYSLCDKLTHSQTIMPMTDEILKNLNITLKDIDVFSVCIDDQSPREQGNERNGEGTGFQKH